MARKITLIAILAMVALSSCDPDDSSVSKPEGKVSFVLPSVSLNQSGRMKTDSIYAVVVSISDKNGVNVYDKKKLPLYSFDEGYLSEVLAMPPGAYTLDEFLVINRDNQVMYASPMEGSDLEYLVEDPLPLNFVVHKDEVAKVDPEVIKVTGTPASFGYATFSLNIVNTFRFNMAVFAFDGEGGSPALVNSSVEIKSGSTVYYNTELPAATNQIVLNGHASHFNITVRKEGYLTYSRTFTVDELKNYTSTVLMITLVSDENLEVYYPFSGNAKDMSRHARHGTVYGAALTTDHHGNPGSAYHFDGVNDHIDLGDILDDIQLPVTVSAWVKMDPNGGMYYPVLITQDNLPLYNGFDFLVNKNMVGISYGDGNGENHPMFRRGKSTTTLPDYTGVWVHVTAVMKSRDNMSLYVNGVNVGGEYTGQSEEPMNSGFPEDVARIGRWSSNALTHFYKGSIDELKVWSRALTGGEIKASM
jgi:hypothetical protein